VILSECIGNVIGPVIKPITGIWTPANLFANGENGDYVDPNVLSSMTIERDGSGGPPAANDVVGTITGLVNGLTFSAGTDANRAILRLLNGTYYLETDGVNMVLICPAGDWTSPAGQEPSTISVIFDVLEDASDDMVLGWGSTAADGKRYIGCSASEKVSSFTASSQNSSFSVLGQKRIATEVYKGGTDVTLYVDKTEVTGSSKTIIENTPSNTSLILGMAPNGQQKLNGNFYCGLVISMAINSIEQAHLETFMAAKAGLIL